MQSRAYRSLGFVYLMGLCTVVVGISRDMEHEFAIVGLVMGFVIIAVGFFDK